MFQAGKFIIRWTPVLSNRFDSTAFKKLYGELYKSFGEDYVFAINPEMPEPYDTFANTFSY